MNTYVALLRGINVGGHATIEMKALKALFESLGYQQVKTYINSGNVLFQSEKEVAHLKTHIESAIHQRFDVFVPVILRTAQEVQAMVTAFPQVWRNDEDQKTDILFLNEGWDGPSALSQIRFDPKVDHLIALPKAIGWSVDRKDYPKSGMKQFIGTPVYKAMTARNINTLRKLNDLLNALQQTSS